MKYNPLLTYTSPLSSNGIPLRMSVTSAGHMKGFFDYFHILQIKLHQKSTPTELPTMFWSLCIYSGINSCHPLNCSTAASILPTSIIFQTTLSIDAGGNFMYDPVYELIASCWNVKQFFKILAQLSLLFIEISCKNRFDMKHVGVPRVKDGNDKYPIKLRNNWIVENKS